MRSFDYAQDDERYSLLRGLESLREKFAVMAFLAASLTSGSSISSVTTSMNSFSSSSSLRVFASSASGFEDDQGGSSPVP